MWQSIKFSLWLSFSSFFACTTTSLLVSIILFVLKMRVFFIIFALLGIWISTKLALYFFRKALEIANLQDVVNNDKK